jgi:uncharacterized protein (TIGR00730 family)
MTNKHFSENEKNWPVMKITDSWQIFKIMAEFVQGFEKLSAIGPCVSIFGSARTKPDNKYYPVAVEVAEKLCEAGYGVITGGGPGIMEAGNKGAKNVNGKSVGVSIDLPFETKNNDYIDRDKLIHFDYFFVRKVMLVKYAQAFVVFPGGYGTMDELFEALTLIQTKKIDKFPIVLVGTEFWQGLLDWLQNVMQEREGNINADDLFMFKVADTADDVINIITEFYKTDILQPNF